MFRARRCFCRSPWPSRCRALSFRIGIVMDGLLLEREVERSALHEGCVAVGAGAGRVIAIVGEAGIGKTALLHEARRLAGESGMRVLRASGATLERDFGYGVVRQLLEREVHALAEADRERLFSGPSAPAADVFGIALRGGGVARDTDRAFLVRHALVIVGLRIGAARAAGVDRRRSAVGGRRVAALAGASGQARRGSAAAAGDGAAQRRAVGVGRGARRVARGRRRACAGCRRG